MTVCLFFLFSHPGEQVCPVSVMSNWEAQLNEHSDGSLTFCLYHGSARSAHTPAALAKTDVVVTTYGCLVADAALLGKVRHMMGFAPQSNRSPQHRSLQALE